MTVLSSVIAPADTSADSCLVIPPKCLMHTHQELEARVGIEPTDEAFAEPCLTTWLPRHGDAKLNFLLGLTQVYFAAISGGIRGQGGFSATD